MATKKMKAGKVRAGLHYATIITLAVSNLTVLALAILFSNSLLSGSMTDIYLSNQRLNIADAAPQSSTTPSSVVINQQLIHFGDSVNFTAVYPKEATRSVTTVQHENPDVALNCYQNGARVASFLFAFPKETNNRDGSLTGISNFLPLGPFNSNGFIWSGGEAICYATLYYFGKDRQIHILAEQRDIYVAP